MADIEIEFPEFRNISIRTLANPNLPLLDLVAQQGYYGDRALFSGLVARFPEPELRSVPSVTGSRTVS